MSPVWELLHLRWLQGCDLGFDARRGDVWRCQKTRVLLTKTTGAANSLWSFSRCTCGRFTASPSSFPAAAAPVGSRVRLALPPISSERGFLSRTFGEPHPSGVSGWTIPSLQEVTGCSINKLDCYSKVTGKFCKDTESCLIATAHHTSSDGRSHLGGTASVSEKRPSSFLRAAAHVWEKPCRLQWPTDSEVNKQGHLMFTPCWVKFIFLRHDPHINITMTSSELCPTRTDYCTHTHTHTTSLWYSTDSCLKLSYCWLRGKTSLRKY